MSTPSHIHRFLIKNLIPPPPPQIRVIVLLVGTLLHTLLQSISRFADVGCSGAFAKLRKVYICFVMFVCQFVFPPVYPLRTTRLPLGRFLIKFDIWVFFDNPSTKLKVLQNPTRIAGALHGDCLTGLIIYFSFILRRKNISCREIQNPNFMFNNIFFRRACRLWDKAEKLCRVEEATHANTAHAHCMLETLGY
jgi:hypothetical protein